MGVPNWKNRTLFHGDNLKFLRAMNSESVHLIATDPPFNKGRDFHATPDSLASGASFQDRWSWDRDVHQEWVDQITDDFPKVMNVIQGSRSSYGDDMGAFLCFIAVRLLELHRILREDGSIYLHCDPTASHYLKALMDAIFGRNNFRNEIVWRRTGSHNSADRFGPIHDIILFYSKPDYKHTIQFTPYLRGHVSEYFKKEDNIGRYWTNSIHGSGIRHGESGKSWRGYDPTKVGRHWAIPSKLILAFGIDPRLPQHEKLDALYELGLIDMPAPNSSALPTYRQYLKDSPGQPMQDLWVYQPYTKGFLEGTDEEIDRDVRWIPKRDRGERTGYPTQKPIGLYSRIILSSSKENDIVLDPFEGCATTLVAAERLRRQWVGIDIWKNAQDVIVDRLEKEGLTAPKYTRRTTVNHQTYLFAEDMHFTSELPERTDDGEEAVPFLIPTFKRELEPWEKLSRIEIFQALCSAQSIREGYVICAGCGREMESPFMELDHVKPRSGGGENDISNRILLCRPCNGINSNDKTMPGLHKDNNKSGWMMDYVKAKRALDLAKYKYQEIRHGTQILA